MKLSVVIPALDEAENIEAAVLSALPGASPSVEYGSVARDPVREPDASEGVDLEVLVVDGGSRDDTRERALRAGARVLETSRGRAHQLDTGVRESDGDVLLFLHADTRLPRGWTRAVQRTLRDPSVVGGAFGFGFDQTSRALRLIELGARVRNRVFALPYGDQALFVRRRVLDSVDGVPLVPIMEDLDLVVALKRRGRLALLPERALTSARRYLERGPLRTMLWHWVLAALWALDVPRSRIARWARR